MTQMKFWASCVVLVLTGSASENARAEHWIQASPADSRVWYDADNIRSTANGLIGVWVSTGPNRTSSRADGTTSYPTYSIIDCRHRTAGSQLSLHKGEASISYASNSGMGELIDKVCS